VGGDEGGRQGSLRVPLLPLRVERVDVPDLPVHDLRDELEGEDRFDRGGAAGDAGDRPRRGDRQDRGVPPGGSLIDGLIDVREASLEGAQLRARLSGFGPEKGSQPVGETQGLPGIITEPGLQEEVRPAHDPQPDPAVRPGHLGDPGQGILVDIDDVVQEPDGDFHDSGESFPVEGVRFFRVMEVGDVDRAQVAGLVGVQGLFAAGIGRPDGPLLPGGIRPVDPVDEDEAGIAHGPGGIHHQAEDVRGLFFPDLPAVSGIADGVGAIPAEGLHEFVGDGRRDVEVGQALAVPLHGDEFLDVRVIDPEDADVGAPPRSALFDGLGGGVDDPQERDRSGSDALGFTDETSARPKEAEIEARSAALLVDERRVLDRVEDGFHRILDGQDEAGAEAHVASGAGQGGAVGEEIPVQHDFEKTIGPLLPGGPAFLGAGDEGRHAREKIGRGLVQEIPLVVLEVIPGFQDLDGVLGKAVGRLVHGVILFEEFAGSMGLLYINNIEFVNCIPWRVTR